MLLALLCAGTFALILALQSSQRAHHIAAAARSSSPSLQQLAPRARHQPVQLDPASRESSQPRTRLDTEPFDALVAAGIGADDSEQRSLAIRELARAPADQAFDGLRRILIESQDRRSRLDALDEMMNLSGGEWHSPSLDVLARLARDADSAIAESAIAQTSRLEQRH